jgi:hypothetical protein
MSSLARAPAAIAATVAAMLASASTTALAQDTHTLADNEGLFIDGKALTVTPGRAKGDVTSQIGNVSVRPLGPGAIVFRAGDRLYMLDGAPMGAQAMYDPAIDRQRSYGGLSDPYPGADRQRSYGGLSDPYPGADRQRSYGGLSDPYPGADRQRS